MTKNKPTIDDILKLAQDIKEWRFTPYYGLPQEKDKEIIQGHNGPAIITIGYGYTIVVDDYEKEIWTAYFDDPRIKELYEKIRSQLID